LQLRNKAMVAWMFGRIICYSQAHPEFQSSNIGEICYN
jgi:hypothetical protein